MQTPRQVTPENLTYNDYLQVPELLALQKPQSSPAHHDELLFIIIHQAYELWFKLILHELETARGLMLGNEPLQAQHFVARAVEILRLLVPQIHILETMRPVDFLQFRDRLNPASGFQSLQFREVEFLCGLKDRAYFRFFQDRPEMIAALERREREPDLRQALHALARAQGLDLSSTDQDAVAEALLPIYQEPQKHLPFYLLLESLITLDELLQLWREHHVRVVERIIGSKTGTGGSSGVQYLQSTTAKKAFPALWDLRGRLHK